MKDWKSATEALSADELMGHTKNSPRAFASRAPLRRLASSTISTVSWGTSDIE